MTRDDRFRPLVSIITPVRNRARFLKQAVDSVLEQDYPHVEHVVVDGASTDGTTDLLRDYSARFPDRVRFISEPDHGACDAWNKGWSLARGDIFGWLGADDFLEPGAINTVVSHFRKLPHAHFIYGECSIADETGRVIGRYATSDYDRARYVNAANGIAAMAAFYTRQLVETVGPLDTTMNLCDCDYWIRAAEKFRLHRIPEVLANFRYHDISVTRNLQGSTYLSEQFTLNRRYGGSLFSPVGRRYLRYLWTKVPGANWLARAIRSRNDAADSFSRVAIFGAALSGRNCLETLLERGIDVIYFIDNAPPPGGLFMDRRVVTPAEADWTTIDAVYIASSGRSAEMIRELKQKKYTGPAIIWNTEPTRISSTP